MRKKEKIAKISEELGVSKALAKKFLELHTSIIIDQIKSGNQVRLPKIGTLKTVDRAARMGINPQNQEKIEIPAKKAIRFRASKSLKAEIN